jgi:hypothetical protein
MHRYINKIRYRFNSKNANFSFKNPNLSFVLVAVAIIGVFGFLLLTSVGPFSGGLFNAIFPKPASQAASLVDLSITQPKVQAAVGQDFSVNVTMNTNQAAVSAAEVHVKYDPTLFQVKAMSAGTMLPVVLVQPTFGNGQATLTVGSQPTSPANGIGNLATITFTPLTSSASPSQITFDSNTQIAATGQSGNVVNTLAPSTVSFSSPGAVSLNLNPSSALTSSGQTFTETVDINTGGDSVSAADVHLSFDPSKVQVQSITAGTTLPVVLTAGVFDNTAGTIGFTYGSQPTSPFNGTGTLATIVFKSTANNPSVINFSSGTQTASTGKSGNTTGAMNSAYVNAAAVTSTATPNPTPTVTPGTPPPTPTPTPTPNAGKIVNLTMAPATQNVPAATTFNVALNINTGTDQVSAADLHVTFDPTKVQVQSVTAGTVLPVVLSAGAFDNTAGTAAITLGSQPTTPFTGTGTVATITFKAVGVTSPNTTSIAYASTTATASVGKTGNTLNTALGATLTVNTGPTATPTGTPTPTPTGTPGPTPTPLPAKVVNLSISPTPVTTQVGQTFTVSLNMNTGTDSVSAADVHVSYDQTKLQVQSVTAGTFLPVVLAAGAFDNTAGSASITVGSQPTTPANGTGTLATVTFKALATGSTAINYLSTTQTASVGKSGNTLNTATGSNVTINPAATTSPTPTPTPTPTDSTPPTVSITSPANNATVSGSVTVNANASDNVGVSKVEFYVDGTLKNTDTSAPYASTAIDTTTLSNALHTLSAKAYDALNNSATTSIGVTVQNGDTTPPSAPTNLHTNSVLFNQVVIAWTASTDNVGVSKYFIVRNGTTIGQENAPNVPFADTTVTAATTYSYQVIAQDAAGNNSAASTALVVTTPTPTDTTPPSAPSNLVGTAASTSQINLTWTASTDNVGVTGYQIFRNNTMITTVPGSNNSFGDTGLTVNTSYSYFVKAVDAANNVSAASNTVNVSTSPNPTPTPTPSSAPKVVNLTMSPSTVTTTANQTFTVSLNMNAGTDSVSAADIHVAFDPTKVQAQAVTAGTMLPVVLATGVFDNTLGTATITLGSQPTTPATGSGTVATITFKAISSGSTSVNYAVTTQTASVGKTGNTLNSTSGSAITISGGATPTPTSTATGTPAPTPTPTPNAGKVVNLTMAPATSTVTQGSNFTESLNINTGTDQVSAADLHITFDPTRVAVQSITAGTALPVVLTAGTFDNTAGTASITLGSQPTTPFTGSGALATVTFRSVGSGSAAIAYAATTQTASVGKTGNTLNTATGATVTITATVTPSPTPTKTPSPTPTASPTPTGTPGPTPTPAPTKQVNMTMSPTPITTQVGQTFTVSLLMSTGTDSVSAADVHVAFDPTKLQAQAVTAGTMLPVVLATGSFDNTAGSASITLGSQPTTPVNGNGTLATITFKSLASGSTALTYLSTTQTASIGKTGNTLNSATGANVTINSSSTATPTSTPSPTPGDTTAPTVSITAPANNATVSGNVTITANAADNVGVTKVEFYVDGTLKNTDTSSPYASNAIDTTALSNALHTLTAKAYDAANNSSTAAIGVTVQNGDTTAPSTPTNLHTTSVSFNQVVFAWNASTDNVGVSKYFIIRNGSTIGSVNSPTLTFTDTNVNAQTNYSYQVIAQDAAGNNSPSSATLSVTTPVASDTTPPTAPSNLVGSAVSQTQINLTWTASTDNVGVASYRITRNNVILNTISGSSNTFGDTGLTAGTNYTYFVEAIDATGNISPKSNTATVTTPSNPTPTPSPTGLPKVVNLTMAPPTVNTSPNQTFTVSLNMNTGGDNVSAVDLHVAFDPTKVQAQSVTAGTMLPVVLVAGAFDNTAGTATITLGSQPTTPANGSGTVATITFKAIASGSTSVNYAVTTQTASVGKTGNTLNSAAGSAITISSGATPTPTGTASPSPTPTKTPSPTPTATPTPGKVVNLTMAPVTLNTTTNQTFTVNLNMNTGPDQVSAAELHLTFDKARLQAQSITAGTMLPVLLTAGTFDNAAGTASIIVGSQPTAPVTSSGTVATITFKALATGTAAVSYANTTITASVGRTGSSLNTTTGSTITIAQGGTPTPTPSPTPSPSPVACSITSAVWGSTVTSVVEGTNVNMSVTANTACVGKTLLVDVQTDTNTEVSMEPANVTITDVTTAVPWKTEFHPGTNNTYHFIATIGGNTGSAVKSALPDLVVTQSTQPAPSSSSSSNSSASSTPAPTTSSGCGVKLGDLNGDCKVNIFDLSAMLRNWGKSGSGILGDFNGDGKVNIFDLSILLRNWGK